MYPNFISMQKKSGTTELERIEPMKYLEII